MFAQSGGGDLTLLVVVMVCILLLLKLLYCIYCIRRGTEDVVAGQKACTALRRIVITLYLYNSEGSLFVSVFRAMGRMHGIPHTDKKKSC